MALAKQMNVAVTGLFVACSEESNESEVDMIPLSVNIECARKPDGF